MEKPGLQVIQIDGKVGLKVNHICIMMSPKDAEQLGHDMIIEAAGIKAESQAEEEG